MDIIKETGLYKTKNGKQVYISTIDENWTFGMIEGCVEVDNWDTNGDYFDRDETEFDIVSKWEK